MSPLGTGPIWISSFTFGGYGLGLCLTGLAIVGGVVRLKPCSSKIICCPRLGCWPEVPGSWIPFPVSYPGLVMKGVFWTVEGTSRISGPWRLGCGRVTSWGSSSSQERLEPKKAKRVKLPEVASGAVISSGNNDYFSIRSKLLEN